MLHHSLAQQEHPESAGAALPSWTYWTSLIAHPLRQEKKPVIGQENPTSGLPPHLGILSCVYRNMIVHGCSWSWLRHNTTNNLINPKKLINIWPQQQTMCRHHFKKLSGPYGAPIHTFQPPWSQVHHVPMVHVGLALGDPCHSQMAIKAYWIIWIFGNILNISEYIEKTKSSHKIWHKFMNENHQTNWPNKSLKSLNISL